MRSSLVILAVGCAAATATAQPKLTADQRLDAPVSTAALFNQDLAAVAAGNAQAPYLAVWRDGGTNNAGTVRAARLDATGTPLDDPPLTVNATCGLLCTPAVAFDGKRFLVVWEAASPTVGNGTNVLAAYVTTAGAVTAPFTVIDTLGTQHQPSVSGGDDFALITWANISNDIRATLLDSTGAVKKSNFLVSTPTVNTLTLSPAVRWGGAGPSNFLVAWVEINTLTSLRSVKAAAVSSAGVVATPILVNTPVANAEAYDPSIAVDASTYLVAWTDTRDMVSTFSEIYARAVPFAAPPSAADFLVAKNATTGLFSPQVVAAAGGFLSVWEWADPLTGAINLYAGRFTAAGVRSDGDGVQVNLPPAAQLFLPSGSSSLRSALAASGTKAILAVALATSQVTSGEAMVLPLDAPTPPTALAPTALTLVSRGRNFQAARSVASDGQTFLVVFEDDRNVLATGIDIYGLRVGLDGTPVDAAPFIICDAPGDQFTPVVAARPGGDYLVAWSDRRPANAAANIWANRVNATGQVRDGQGFPVSASASGQVQPTVAAGASGWLVAWEDWRGVAAQNFPGVSSALVTGMMTAPTQAVVTPSTKSTTACAPAAVWNGQRFFVAYEQPCGHFRTVNAPVPASQIFGNWVSAAGAVNTTAVTIANLGTLQTSPALASDGSGQLVAVWRDQAAMPGDVIRAGRIADNATGLTGSATALYSSAGTHESPSVAWASGTPGTILVSWVEASPPGAKALRTNALLQALDPAAFPLLSAAVSRYPDPLPVPPPADGSSVAAQPLETPPAAVAASPTGQALVLFDEVETLAQVPVPRVHFRKLGIAPSGAGCATATGCADGICTARGTCCDTLCDGTCQACGASGCILTPATDNRCGMVSCAALSNACRSYTTTAPACMAFNECGRSNDPETCANVTFTVINEAGACRAPGCSKMGACRAGDCVCPDPPRDYGGPRAPAGCQVGGPAAGGGAIVALLFLAWLCRRRRRWLVAAWLWFGACDASNVMQVDLLLDDAMLRETAVVRVVIRNLDGPAFPLAPAQPGGRADEIVRNVDLDGDGDPEIVVDLLRAFPLLRRTTYLKVVPAQRATHRVSVFAQALNRYGNPIAEVRDVQGVLPGGAIKLAPHCIMACSGSVNAALAAPLVDLGRHAITSLAAAPLPDQLVAIGVGSLDAVAMPADPLRPNRGAVLLYHATSDGAALELRGRQDGLAAGDQLGTAVALGDVNGDGQLDLVMGAPGAANQAGRVSVLYGPLSSPGRVSSVDGAPSDQLGSTLVLVDLTGDGVPEIIAGAPGANGSSGNGTIYALSGASPDLSRAPRVTGQAAGAHLGRSLASWPGLVAAGAPGANAVYVLTPSDFRLPTGTPSTVWSSAAGGGLGAAVALIDLDGDGRPEVVGSASTGAGAVLIVDAPTAPMTLDDGAVHRAIRIGTAGVHLGSMLARVPTTFGDLLAVGALPDPGAVPMSRGAAFVLTGAAIDTAGSELPLAFGSTLAALDATLGDGQIGRVAAADVLTSPGVEIFFGDDQGRLFVYAPEASP